MKVGWIPGSWGCISMPHHEGILRPETSAPDWSDVYQQGHKLDAYKERRTTYGR